MGYNVAIDGPAGAGKSTIAKRVAKEKGYIYVDTGAMYRALAVYFLDKKINPENLDAIAAACEGAEVKIQYEQGEQQVYLNGENITSRLRNEEVGNMASKVSAVPEVRAHLLNLQKELARTQDVVMDGRDIGTAVLPNADLKIYLTASSRTRAERRCKELVEKVNVELKRQVAYLSRKEIIEESLQNYGGAILVKDLKEAFEVSNYLAPEHLEVLVENPVNTLPYIKNAGSIFLGEYSPEPLGDYMSGTNHVLPTGGTAKFYSALGVYDFVKYSSYSYYPKDVLETFKDDVQTFAKSEGLDAHANSIAVRFEEE